MSLWSQSTWGYVISNTSIEDWCAVCHVSWASDVTVMRPWKCNLKTVIGLTRLLTLAGRSGRQLAIIWQWAVVACRCWSEYRGKLYVLCIDNLEDHRWWCTVNSWKWKLNYHIGYSIILNLSAFVMFRPILNGWMDRQTVMAKQYHTLHASAHWHSQHTIEITVRPEYATYWMPVL